MCALRPWFRDQLDALSSLFYVRIVPLAPHVSIREEVIQPSQQPYNSPTS
jgi:hypothetical protein